MTIQTFNGHNYDMDDDTQVQALMTAMAGVINNQSAAITTANNTINTLQLGQPIALQPAQFQQLIGGRQQQQQPQAINVVNPVMTARARAQNAQAQDVMYEEIIPEGMKDSKTIRDAREWNGTKEDAKPFIIRLKGYFKSRPNAMRFTRNKILYTLDLLNDKVSRTWAALVRRAIAEDQDNEYYFDNWDEFQREFIKRFGLRHEQQNFFIKMTSFKIKKGKDLKDSIALFDHFRTEAQVPKDQAFFFLQHATPDEIRGSLMMRQQPPTNYDEWMKALTDMQYAADGYNEHKLYEGLHPKRANTSYQGRPQFRSSAPPPDPDAMQVDAIRQRSIKGKGKKVITKGKPSNKARRLAPHPNASGSTSKPSSSSKSSSKTAFVCYACNKPGHYARNCKTKNSEIPIEYIRSMGMMIEAFRDQQAEDEEIEEGDSQSEEDSDEEEQSLIDLESNDEEEEEDLGF